MNMQAASDGKLALHRFIDGVRTGLFDAVELTAPFAELVQVHWLELRDISLQLGAIQAIEYISVGAAGWDLYDVYYERGIQRWRVALTPAGKIRGAHPLLGSILEMEEWR